MSTINTASSIASNKPLDKLNVFSFSGVQMRTFHITWFTFFICFFAWFGLKTIDADHSRPAPITEPSMTNAAAAT